MKGDVSNFKRVEKKYMFTIDKYNELMKRLDTKLDPNEFPNSSILNIYFDTDNYDLAIKSIQKPIYKEKLRIRSYGVPKRNSKVFVEIKKKYNKVVNKRRISLKLSDAYNLVENNVLPEIKDDYQNKQILSELVFKIIKSIQ